jgi:uncharacterized membrane protein/ribosomal protein L37E
MPSERRRGPDEVFCRHCGEAIKVQAEVCPHCGVRNEQYNRSMGRAGGSADGFGRDTANSGTGLDANVAAALSYALTFVSGIAVYVLEDDDRFVRFHAAQSIAVFGALAVANVVMSGAFAAVGIGSIAALLGSLLSFVGFGLWVFLIVTAYRGETYRIPVAADIADKLVSGPDGASPTPSDSNSLNGETATEPDPLAALRTRYARGEIGEAEFERRLERLLESEHEDERRREPADPERSR